MNELGLFEWKVPLYGYEWSPGKGRGDKRETLWMTPRLYPPGLEGITDIEKASLPKWRKWYELRTKELAPVRSSQNPGGDQEYRPFETTPALFRNFASSDPNRRDPILSFANRYGWLGPVWPFARRGAKDQEWGMAIDFWERAILKMKRAVDLWDALRNWETSALEQWFKGVGRDLKAGLWNWPGAPFGRHSVPNTIVGYAYDALEGIVNHALEDVPFRLAPVERPIPRTDMGRFSPLALFGQPKHLLDAMWLQFAFAIQGNTRFLFCARCHDWFKPSNKANRGDVRFCSSRCRVAAYRAGKAESKPTRRRRSKRKTGQR